MLPEDRPPLTVPAPPVCDYFVRCERPVEGHVVHPVAGRVASCARCAGLAGLRLHRPAGQPAGLTSGAASRSRTSTATGGCRPSTALSDPSAPATTRATDRACQRCPCGLR